MTAEATDKMAQSQSEKFKALAREVELQNIAGMDDPERQKRGKPARGKPE